MESNTALQLIKKTNKIEKQLVGEIFLSNGFNDVVAFTQTYIANYLPVLMYSIKHFETNQIAKLMNSSIMIDNLLKIKMNEIVRRHTLIEIKETIGDQNIEKTIVIKLLNNLSEIQKANLSSNMLFMFSFMRSALFSCYCDNKLYVNYGIGWNNLFMHFIENPHLSFLFDKEIIEHAEKELDFIENDIVSENSKLEKEINDVLVDNDICNEDEMCNVTKHWIGLKCDWIKAKALIAYIKFLKYSKKKYIKEAKKYAYKLVKLYKSEEYDYYRDSFRSKMDYPGPAVFIPKVLGELGDYDKIIRIFNYGLYLEKGNDKKVIMLPTNVGFYFNRSLIIGNRKPLIFDEEFILDVNERGCSVFIDLIDYIVKPKESEDYKKWYDIYKLFIDFEKYGLSSKFIHHQLKNSILKEDIMKVLNKTIDKNRMFLNVFVLTSIAGINSYAEAKGYIQMPDYVNITVPMIIEIITKVVYKTKLDKLLLELYDDEEQNNEILEFIDGDDEYATFENIEKQIECLEDATEDILEFIDFKGLSEIHTLNISIRKLIMSSSTIEEINSELEKLYESLSG